EVSLMLSWDCDLEAKAAHFNGPSKSSTTVLLPAASATLMSSTNNGANGRTKPFDGSVITTVTNVIGAWSGPPESGAMGAESCCHFPPVSPSPRSALKYLPDLSRRRAQRDTFASVLSPFAHMLMETGAPGTGSPGTTAGAASVAISPDSGFELKSLRHQSIFGMAAGSTPTSWNV